MDSTFLANLIWLISLVAHVAVIVMALIYIPRDRKPTAAMAWLLLIILFPFFGIVFYLLIGNFALPKKRRNEQARIDTLIKGRASAAGTMVADQNDWPRWFQRIAQQNEALTALPAMAGNEAALYGEYQASIDAMTVEIDHAQKWVHVEFFIVGWDDTTREFFSAMERAVQRGVSVKLLADHISSGRVAHSKETFAELDRIGVRWSWMLPVMPFKGKYQRPDLRNHRKIVVVDGLVAFMGSQNLISRDYDSEKNIKRGLKWQELVTRLTGPVVASVNAVFLSDWLIETDEDLVGTEHVPVSDLPVDTSPNALVCQVVPSGPGYTTENNLRLFLSLIYGATEKVILTSPYFVPDEAMVYAITTACQRGLEVPLFVSEIGDQGLVYHAQRSYYDVLLEAGVKIFLYPAPFILHSKHFSIDDDIAVIGSSNMDIRSFSLNMEISLLVLGESFVAAMREVEQGYRDAGRQLTLEEWRNEPAKATFLDGIARLTSAVN
ncbi:cardiolipin synthase [Microbacterium allomyrinae]|uniref:Cardiolipin synthase n=1 Tax=Microbacterium allomyrinae TaxID=2830666 RepID=A0A9X1LSL8_9MICO|nr:cardiolipin synthase [Microbacterium allomyrinae]MCC2031067.1 cardiolipin synthase [Microbacterium allomyrinae]